MRLEKCTKNVPIRVELLPIILLFLGFITSLSDVSAQCNFNCQDHVYLSLDADCSFDLEPEYFTRNLGCTTADVKVYDHYNNEIMTVGREHRGKKLVYKVVDPVSNNSCWGYVTFEDKFAPEIMCNDDTLNCWDAAAFLEPEIEDNCWDYARMETIALKWNDYDCENDTFVGYYQRDVVTYDLWGNTNRCTDQRIYVTRETLDSLVCDTGRVIECCAQKELADGSLTYVLWHPDYAYEDEDGYSHPIPKPGGLVEPPYLRSPEGRIHWLTPNSNNKGKCNIITTYKDHIIPTCGYSYKIRREWKIFDWCTSQETLCVQWIKIIDTLAPILKSPNSTREYKTVCADGQDYQWNPDCDTITALDLTPSSGARTFYVKSHDCKAHVTLKRPDIEKDCSTLFAAEDKTTLENALSKIKVSYLIRYVDYWSEGLNEKVLSGDIPYGEEITVYLPKGWFNVIYFVKDECWNETYACEQIGVVDNIPPTPVCDEITQVTLDPEYCWTRIYAEDLDDGSNDNCSHKLHFAVALQDSIESYTAKWNEELLDCLGEYDYNHYKYFIDELIEKWINCYVFNDYIDVSECGEDQVVLRVYEADGLPLYDPHIFKGSKHQWFCYNLFDDYACWFGWNYDKVASYEMPMPNICTYSFSDLGYSYFKVNSETTNCFGPCTPEIIVSASTNRFQVDKFDGIHGPQYNPVCCDYMLAGDNEHADWLELIEAFPELYSLHCKRYEFPYLYNDCWIRVLKDDKEPPICIAPDPATYYCDGVPYAGSFAPNNGDNILSWEGAQFAHDICTESDTWDPNCFWDVLGDGLGNFMAPNDWCVAAPWDVEGVGCYAGPSQSEYSYEDPCNDELLAWYPDDIRSSWKPIYCRFWLMLDRYDDPSYGKPDPYTYFGTPTFEDNCWYPDIDSTTEGSLDECGVGILTRTWVVTDKCDNTSSCYQTITIKPRSDFEVKFPEDVTVECDDLDNLDPVEGEDSYPVVKDDDCELIGITYSDQTIDIEQDGCFKILRTWKVIDWCVYRPEIHSRYPDVIVNDKCVAGEDRPCVVRELKDDGDGYMIYLQVLKVVDDVAPEVVCNPDSLFCIYDENCEDLFVEYDLGTATDNCTEELQYRYAINPNGDSDEADWIYGHGTTIQNTLPVGEHTVTLYAKDDCGNEGYCELVITIKDCKPPTPYCYNGIATVVMPSTGEVTVWARDLDAGSFDNCTAQENLRFTFTDTHPDEDPDYSDEDLSSSMSFDCDQLGQVTVNIYVWDEWDNVDFCETYLLIQPGTDACPGASLSTIAGDIQTEMIEAVEFAKVELASNSTEGSEFETGVDGSFTFSNLSAGNDYTIAPERNDEHDNGVSTLDLVLIQKHILGIEKVGSPYKVIAADINNSESVTALDLVELRKLILGVNDEFENNTSWRFVPSDYEFADAENPWGFPESIEFNELPIGTVTADFVGIKIGDMNATVQAHSLQGAVVRNTSSKLVFNTQEQDVVAGTEVMVSLTADNFINVSGYQFTLETKGLELNDIASANLEISEDNFGIHKNQLTTSWNAVQGMSFDGELFTLSFIATESGKLSEMLNIHSGITTAEAYVADQIVGINLEFVDDDNQIVDGDFRLMQNSPNPFGEQTVIGFVLPEAGAATLEVMDVQGKSIMEINGDYNKGFNQISLDRKDLNTDGVLYYKLKSGDFVATKKMILIK